MAVLSLLLKILVMATLETAEIHCCVQRLSEVFALIIAHEIMAPTGLCVLEKTFCSNEVGHIYVGTRGWLNLSITG